MSIFLVADVLMKGKLYTIKSYTLFYIYNIAKLTALTLAGIGMYVYSYFITSEILKATMGLITIYLILPNILISYFQFGSIESICRHYKKKKLS